MYSMCPRCCNANVAYTSALPSWAISVSLCHYVNAHTHSHRSTQTNLQNTHTQEDIYKVEVVNNVALGLDILYVCMHWCMSNLTKRQKMEHKYRTKRNWLSWPAITQTLHRLLQRKTKKSRVGPHVKPSTLSDSVTSVTKLTLVVLHLFFFEAHTKDDGFCLFKSKK